MHANVAEDVIYAGEFCVSKNLINGNMVLVIDNNSGFSFSFYSSLLVCSFFSLK